MARATLLPLILTGAIYATVGCSMSLGQSSSGGAAWLANGATACQKYLTPDVMAAVLVTATGQPQRLDANSCHAGMIHISLTSADIDVFRKQLPRIAGAHAMTGVGDGAYWNEAGAVSAVKGHNRGCDISVVGPPDAMKIHGATLGQKLGAICNALLALP